MDTLIKYIAIRSLWVASMGLLIADANANSEYVDRADPHACHEKMYPDKTERDKIKIGALSFSCQAITDAMRKDKVVDGVIVPKKYNKANKTCIKPEGLYNRCVFNSTLGRLTSGSGGKGVDTLFSCRKSPFAGDKTYETDKTNEYYDIAMIQHNRETGATCFYQHLGNTSQKLIPDPRSKLGKKFWEDPVINCTSCHTNGAFVRTPHYSLLKDSTGRILPMEQDIDDKKYHVLAHSHYKPWKAISFPKNGHGENVCISCHNIGAFKSNGLTAKYRLGKMNEMASGLWKSLKVTDATTHPVSGQTKSPTKDGYYDFMVKGLPFDLKREDAICAILQLKDEMNKQTKAHETCLKGAKPNLCKLELKEPKTKAKCKTQSGKLVLITS